MPEKKLQQNVNAVSKKSKSSSISAKNAALSPAPSKVVAELQKLSKKVNSQSKVATRSERAIARAAYLNYLQRVAEGLPSDPYADWLKAEQQLGL